MDICLQNSEKPPEGKTLTSNRPTIQTARGMFGNWMITIFPCLSRKILLSIFDYRDVGIVVAAPVDSGSTAPTASEFESCSTPTTGPPLAGKLEVLSFGK